MGLIKTQAGKLPLVWQERVKARLEEILAETGVVDETRLAQEVAFLAERSLIALQSIKKPWAHLLEHAEGEALDNILSVPAHFVTKTISGKKCKTKAGPLDEFSRVFSFPDYFGHNWDALEECLADLDWLPAKGYLVVVTDADQVLTKPDEEDDFETFVDILSEAGEAWSLKESDEAAGDGLPFDAVLAVSDRHKRSRHNWFAPPLAMERKPSKSTPAKGAKKPSR